MVEGKRRVSLAPEDASSHVALGWAFLQNGRLTLSEASYHRALVLDPEHPPALLGLAAIHLCRGEPEAAERLRARAAPPTTCPPGPMREAAGRIAPGVVGCRTPDADPERARSTGLSSATREALEDVMARECRGASGWHQRGVACVLLNRAEEALSAFRRALELDPLYAPACSGLGILLAKRGEEEAARTYLQKAVELDPQDARAVTNLGVCHRQRGDLEAAIACYRRALELRPEELEARYDLALALADSGRTEEAIAHYREVLKRDGQHLRALCGLAMALGEVGQVRESVELYQRAVSLSPEDPVLHYFLGLAEVALGHEAGALRQYRVLAELDRDLSERLFAAIYA